MLWKALTQQGVRYEATWSEPFRKNVLPVYCSKIKSHTTLTKQNVSKNVNIRWQLGLTVKVEHTEHMTRIWHDECPARRSSEGRKIPWEHCSRYLLAREERAKYYFLEKEEKSRRRIRVYVTIDRGIERRHWRKTFSERRRWVEICNTEITSKGIQCHRLRIAWIPKLSQALPVRRAWNRRAGMSAWKSSWFQACKHKIMTKMPEAERRMQHY